MKWANYGGRVFESMSALFMVTPIDEFEPATGDLVQLTDCDDHRQRWFVVGEKHEEDEVSWFDVRRATFWERFFGGGRAARSNPLH